MHADLPSISQICDLPGTGLLRSWKFSSSVHAIDCTLFSLSLHKIHASKNAEDFHLMANFPFFRSNFLQVEAYFDEIKYDEEIELPAYRVRRIYIIRHLVGLVLSSNDTVNLKIHSGIPSANRTWSKSYSSRETYSYLDSIKFGKIYDFSLYSSLRVFCPELLKSYRSSVIS